MKSTRFFVCIVGLLAALPPLAWSGCVVPAGASGSNPNSRYVISLYNDEVYDTQTNITWQRCPYNWNVSLDGKSCMKMLGAQDAWSQRTGSHLGPADWTSRGWRIPTGRNLKTLLDHVCSNPAINQEVFPNTPTSNFWTSDGHMNSHGHNFYYFVDFAGGGSTGDHEDINEFLIRLMYPGKSPAIVATLEKRPVATQ